MSNQPNMYHITLLRHGESEGNAKGYHQGQTNFPLSPKGREQAEALAQYWFQEQVTFDKIISSPLLRALQTAEIIAQRLNMPIEQNPLWMERDAGMVSGLHHTIAQEKYPEPDHVTPYDPFGINGESQWDVYVRAAKAVQDLLRRPPGKYLIVSHGGLLDMFMYAILGITPQANSNGPHFQFQNTAYITLLYYPPTHSWIVKGVNNHPHWQEEEND
ncbi:MAG: histidine phosphatase family protein [Chloroflexi bacterium]|nr:histidine phosphatase family protein [Chloroflexota bacterium]